MANWESHRISDIVSDIEDRKIVLPVIQRKLVWDEEKMELLFDTLLKGDSFGGIMVIKEDRNTKPLFSFRPFTKDGESIGSTEVDSIEQTQSFVIDGQQRLQSFYIGLTGSINGKLLYFDLFSNYTTEFNFKFEKDFKKLPKDVKEETKSIRKYLWYSAPELLRKLKQTSNEKNTAKQIIAQYQITDENERDSIEENVAAFSRNTLTYKAIGVCEVAIDKTQDETTNRQRIVELFRRLNDGGTKLSAFDLVASILKGFEWEMETFLSEILAKYNEISLTQENLIKLLFILQDNHVKEMTEIDAKDAKFAINNRGRIESTLQALVKFLHAADLYNYYKDSNRSFIPLFFISYHVFHKDISDRELENYFDNFDAKHPEFMKMEKWIYLSLINGVFRSKGAGWTPYKTGIRKILAVVKEFKNKSFPFEELFEVYLSHGVSFLKRFDKSALDSLDANFLYYLIYNKKITIRVQDIDHIMPKSILIEKGFDWLDINSIRNFQLLDSGTNRGEKNAKAFAFWINNFVTDKDAFVLRHLIPTDQEFWDEDQFKEFIEHRGDLIYEKIASWSE